VDPNLLIMKKVLLFLLAGVMVMGCGKEKIDPNDPNNPNNPPADPLAVLQKQNVFGVNFSGTWCGPCGASGIPALYNASEAHTTRLHAIKVGLNGSGAPDPFNVQGGMELANAYYPPGPRGIPGFGAGVEFHQGNATWRTAVDQILTTPDNQVKAGLAITKEIKGDSLIFKVRMKTFAALPSGVYTVGVFVAEDNLMWPQAGQGTGPFNHKMVFRGNAIEWGSMALGIWGHPVAGDQMPAPVAANTVKEWRFGYLKPQGMNPEVNLTNAYAYAVMMRLNPADYKAMEFVNSARTK
jgi:hypothetical protein